MEALRPGTVDVATFVSPKTAVHFQQLLTDILGEAFVPQVLAQLKIAAIWPVTTETCVEQFGKVDIQPEEYTIEGMVAAVYSQAGKIAATGLVYSQAMPSLSRSRASV
jgi:uroporphyrinogen-III synthase